MILPQVTLDEARKAIRYCNSYNRLEAIIGLASSLECDDWMRLLGENWTCCDNISQLADELLEFTPFGSWERGSTLGQYMMDEQEAAQLAELPEIVTAWRGCHNHNKRGLSWSLDRSTAERFPFLNRYRSEGQPLLVRAEISKADVIALKLDREEAEIIAVDIKIRATRHIKSSPG